MSAVPDRPYRVDDVARRQLAGARDHRSARRAALGIALTGLGHNSGASSAVDGSIYATPAGQLAVRGIDDGIGGLLGNISGHKFQHACTNMLAYLSSLCDPHPWVGHRVSSPLALVLMFPSTVECDATCWERSERPVSHG